MNTHRHRAGPSRATPDVPGATPRQILLGRLDALAAALREDPAALGLLALGSVGADTTRIDAWSDLDFFVVVQPEAKARYIADLAWLSGVHPLVWSYRNTVDGHKALMQDGVLCEFAVFAPAELSAVPYAPGRWVWRRDALAAAGSRPCVPLPKPHDPAWLLGEALSNLMVGLMRHARGERLAAMRMIQVFALDRVLQLAALAPQPEARTGSADAADPFNVDRRLEARCPELAAQLPTWAAGYSGSVSAARSLLAWLQARHTVPAAVAERVGALADACDNLDLPGAP
jgi:hypothetical protein